jgi:pimeloyl-ACP methyl ester carboxylesterase
MAMKERPDSTTTVLEISQPALVITGADDQLIPPSESETLARGLQDSRLEILPNAGHLSNLEQPELFNGAVKDYLRTML